MKTLEELDRLEKAATSGPWSLRATEHSGGIRFVVSDTAPRNANGTEFIAADCSHGCNGELIAAMRNNIRALIDVARAAERILPFIPSGDIFGAGKYAEHNHAAKALREALEKLQK